MSKLVRKTLADCALTPASKRRLAELAARPDSEIDFRTFPPSKRASGKTPCAIRSTGR